MLRQVREELSAIGNTPSLILLTQLMNRSEKCQNKYIRKSVGSIQVSHMGKLKRKDGLEEEEAAKHRVKLREGRTLAR